MIIIQHEADRSVCLWFAEKLLCCYVYQPTTPAIEAPKPYFHPVNSLDGDTLTNFRPNDHPWHHALSMTLNHVSGANFWGGPTCVRGQGYQMLNDHGSQRHVSWERIDAQDTSATLIERLEWIKSGEVLFTERRSMEIAVDTHARAWSLHWVSRLMNVSGRTLSLGNPHSDAGLVGSHYTGLSFRGARELLDDHLDPTIKVIAEGNREGIAAVHGAPAKWMEWHGQLDTTLHRVTIRFENESGPLHWFVRRNSPLMAFPVQFDQNLAVEPGAPLDLNHRITFTSPLA